jgi:hypothetical protein
MEVTISDDFFKTLTCKDIRVGNYIMSGNNGKFTKDVSIIGKVLEIGNEDREFEQIYCECEESFEWFFKDNYFSIPLSGDWLDKFGFQFKDGNYVYNEHLYLQYGVECYAVVWLGKWITNVKSVHHLQNLFQALTLKELTIIKK